MHSKLTAFTADIVAAHVGNNEVAPADLPRLIEVVYRALSAATAPAGKEPITQQPAVPIRSSVKPHYLVSLETGRRVKLLKPYLKTNHGMSPAQYREKWGLPDDYPMVAPAYAQRRREIALKGGLGRPGTGRWPARTVKTRVAEAVAPNVDGDASNPPA